MVDQDFYSGKKINNSKNDILDKISVQMSLFYTQIEENSNILGGMFSNFRFISQYFFEKSRFSILAMIMELQYNG